MTAKSATTTTAKPPGHSLLPRKNGQWEAQLYLPEEIEDNYSPALLAMYALSSSGTEAIGSTTKFYVYGYDDTQATDSIAPEIFLLALGNPSFKPGDTVGSTTTFLAKVRDDSGINISSAGIGKQMMLILDGKTIFDDLSDYFVTDPEDPTGGSISYPLADLQNGDHEFTFQVFDNAGNCAKQTIPFKVGAGIYGELELHTDASPASVEANIYIVTAQQPVEAKVEIFDMAGRCVWSATPDVLSQSMRVNWDLTMKGGTRVPRGIYLYRATVKNADGAEKARTRKIAVTAP